MYVYHTLCMYIYIYVRIIALWSMSIAMTMTMSMTFDTCEYVMTLLMLMLFWPRCERQCALIDHWLSDCTARHHALQISRDWIMES